MPPIPNDSLFRRARRMVGEGNGVAGRALVDSLLKQAEEGSTAYGDALFWRGALAGTAAEAERDYRRVIVEYPLSHYADDALLAIVELEQARGDRAGALAHLQRFVREHPVSSARGVAAFAAARLAFDQRDTKTGCAMITEARASTASTEVELRNQIDYFGSRCTGMATGMAAGVATATATVNAPAPPTATRDTVSKSSKKNVATTAKTTAKTTAPAPTEHPSAPVKSPVAPPAKSSPPKPEPAIQPETTSTKTAVKAPAPKAKGNYTIQLAAYATLTDAEQLVKKLSAKGVPARVSGTSKPFRVRLDFYPTRQAALDEVASLKERGIIGFVTEERPPAGKSP
ncbi:MAG: SPOR domain-containing protein [bacterium]